MRPAEGVQPRFHALRAPPYSFVCHAAGRSDASAVPGFSFIFKKKGLSPTNRGSVGFITLTSSAFITWIFAKSINK